MNISIPHKAARDEGLGCYKLRVRLFKLNETLPNFNRTRNEHNKKTLKSLRELTHGLYFVQIDPALGLTVASSACTLQTLQKALFQQNGKNV